MFGQCWDGEGSVRSAFTLKSGLNGITNDKLLAMENTFEFLNRYHLDWRDYMTQCILSHILSETHEINQNRLEIYYNDCLNKDQLLDEITAVQQQQDNINRRQLEVFDRNQSIIKKQKVSFFLYDYSNTFFFFRFLLQRSIYSINKI